MPILRLLAWLLDDGGADVRRRNIKSARRARRRAKTIDCPKQPRPADMCHLDGGPCEVHWI